MMVAQVTGLKPGEFVHTFGDAHLYLNHLEQARLQLSRAPRALPRMQLNPAVTDLFAFRYEDFTLEGYDPHPAHQGEGGGVSGAARCRRRTRALVLVAAVADNGVIGQGGGLPWRLKSDMQHFRAVTMGKPVVMGRKTYPVDRQAAHGPHQHRGEPRSAISRRPACWSRRASRRRSRRRAATRCGAAPMRSSSSAAPNLCADHRPMPTGW